MKDIRGISKKAKHSINYRDMPSVTWPSKHDDKQPKSQSQTHSSLSASSLSSLSTDFFQMQMKSHLIAKSKLNDLVRDLVLPNIKVQFSFFFRIILGFCNNIPNFIDYLNIDLKLRGHYPMYHQKQQRKYPVNNSRVIYSGNKRDLREM